MARFQDEQMAGLQKAAILLIALGPEKSASIFKHLKEEEIEELTLEIANTRIHSILTEIDLHESKIVELKHELEELNCFVSSSK